MRWLLNKLTAPWRAWVHFCDRKITELENDPEYLKARGKPQYWYGKYDDWNDRKPLKKRKR